MAKSFKAPIFPQGYMPPQAIEVEEAVLAALITDRNAIVEVSGILTKEVFYKEKHGKIYDAILEIYSNGDPIDPLTISQKLKSKGELELVGGNLALMEICDKVSSGMNVEAHSKILQEKFLKRNLLDTVSRIHKKCFDDTEDVFDLLNELSNDILTINISETGDAEEIRSVAKEVMEDAANSMTLPSGINGVESGLTDVDKITGGWQNSDLIIIAARPAMGKTAFVLTCARNAAVRFKKGVGIFSLEMSKKQLVQRLIVGEADVHGLSTSKFKKGRISEEEYHIISKKINQLIDSKIFIDDTAGMSILQLRSKAKKLKLKHGIQLIIVDYLQLMQGSGKGNREQEISEISRGLKMLAKELDIPVIALSQLSRAVEARGGDKRPMLSDLRESGSIEQDADLVAFLYRPEYYNINEDEMGNLLKGVAELIVSKHRSGPIDTIPLRYIGEQTKFEDINRIEIEKQAADNYRPNDFGARKPYKEDTEDLDDLPF